MQQKKLTLMMTFALYGTLPVAMAQESANDSAVLSPVTVTADNNAGVADVVTITEQSIENATENDPRSLIRNIPGVELENEAIEGFAGFRIRGMGGSGSTLRTGQNRVAVNVDGVQLPDAFRTGHTTRVGLSTFDTADLKAVEIIRGPETSTSGKSGLAGTIRFVTKDPEDYYDKAAGERFGGNVRTGYSDANSSFSIGATVAGQFDDAWSAMLSYSHNNSNQMPNYDKEMLFHDNGGWTNPRDPNDKLDQIKDADIDTNTVMGKVVFEPTAAHRFTFKGEFSERKFDADILADADPTGKYYDKTEGERNVLSLRHDFVLNSAVADEGYWQAYYQDYDNDRETNIAYGMSFGTTGYKVEGYGFEAGLSKTFGTDTVSHTFNYGINFNEYESNARWSWFMPANSFGPGNPPRDTLSTTTYQPDTKTRQLTAYVNDDIALGDGRFHIMPGAEVTHYKIDAMETVDYNGALRDLDDTHFTWRLGASYDITDAHQVFAGYRQGYKVPSFGELNSGSGHGRVNNPDLKPERSAGFTVGLRSQGDIGSQTVSAFYDTYRDLAVNGRMPSGDVGTINKEGKVVIYGVEYQGELDLNRLANLPEGLKVRGALAYAKGDDDEIDQPYSDVDPLSGSVSLAYDAPSAQWGGAVTVNFAAAKKEKDIAENTDLYPIGGYGVTDLTAYYQPVKGLRINAGVYNVFDKKYAKWSEAQYVSIFQQSYNQITEPGRYFGATLRYEF